MNSSQKLSVTEKAPCTIAFFLFINHELIVKEFLTLINILVAGIPITMEYLPEKDPELAKNFSYLWKDLSFHKYPSLFRDLWVQMMVSRTVDNFNVYLSDVLDSVFKVQPQVLRSNEQMFIRDIFEHKTIEELIETLAQNKVNELSRKGFYSVRKYLVERVKIKDDFDKDDLLVASKAIAARNIIVHNRGKIDKQYLRESGRQDLKIGDTLSLVPEEGNEYCQALERIARHIDKALISKFGLAIVGIPENKNQ